MSSFEQLVKDELAPWFDAHGFTKKGLSFARRNAEGWSIVQLQKLRESSRPSTTFTIRIATFSDQIDTTLAPLRRLAPIRAAPAETACHLRRHLHELAAAGALATEHVVDETTDLASLGALVRAAGEAHALPFLDALATDRDLHAYWSMHGPRPDEELGVVVLVRAYDTPDALVKLVAHLRTMNPAATQFLNLLDQLAPPASRRVEVDPITRQIMRSMKGGLAVEKTDPAAFEVALRRCFALDDGTASDLRGDPQFPPFRLRPYLIYATHVTDRGAPERALASLLPLRERWSGEPHLHLALGRVHDKLHDWAAAEAAFRMSNDLDPKPFLCSRIAAMIDNQGGRGDEAIEWLHRTLELDPNYEEAIFNLGCLDERDGDYDAAIARFRRALELDPNYEDARARLGALLNRARR